MNQSTGNNHLLTRSPNQPYRVQLPRFIVNQEIGLGDAVKKVTHQMGIRTSSGCGCDRRAAALNQRVTLSPRNPK